ncbi:hypothetical protein LJC40_06475 [Synergistaceae bacterium OttesenSCG-928-D05]|nr:hypothetical protein [Synergistaceae bacterium OttesenSCG-928-D05]
MKKLTQELLNEIAAAKEMGVYLDENENELINETTQSYLTKLIEEKQLKVADVVQKSAQGDYVYKVFQGARKPSRDILIAIAFGMSLGLEETQRLLRIAGVARLDPRNRRDSVVIYAVSKNLRIEDLNDILYDFSEATF